MTSDEALFEFLAVTRDDPLGFVLGAFPWGESGELATATVEPWQRELLGRIAGGLLRPDEAIQLAVASGHGVGKSALVSWIILWAITTMRDTRGVVTANTETQLKTKTWAELAKWHRLCLAGHLFHLTATALYSKDPEHERTWRIDMVPWSERSTEAFAGLHNKGRRIILVFDEASAIPDVIWETSEGALTDKDTQIIWPVFGNPTRNTGRFRECFESRSHRWATFQVDSRQVSFTNKAQIAAWIADYGEDSDFVRVRVRGEFPRFGTMQFIPSDFVLAARSRAALANKFDPLVMGVDVARFGDDASVIYFRKGRDGRTIAPQRYQGLDLMTLAAKVAEAQARYAADAIFIDGTGVGGGVVDRLRQLRVHCFDVQFGAKPDNINYEEPSTRVANKRAEMWVLMKQWLRVGAIPDDDGLARELIGPEYSFNGRDEIVLESKADMKRRGLESPDLADALALTFALHVQPNEMAGSEWGGRTQFVSDYEPMQYLEVA